MERRVRLSMAGADVAVTDAALAEAIVEYAMHLGRIDMTDMVTLPVARNGQAEVATLLVGPASQIALTWSDDPELDAVELQGVDEVTEDIRHRIDLAAGRVSIVADEPEPTGETGEHFVDFGSSGDDDEDLLAER